MEIILYPTETVYGLGVNALDKDALAELYALKGRSEEKAVSWLVRDLDDIRKYAEVGEVAAKIAKQFLPGPLTLILPLREDVRQTYEFLGPTIGFRISSDAVAQKTISDFYAAYNAPLTCTSANVSGQPTLPSVPEILEQFADRKSMVSTIIDGGQRSGISSTVVEVVDSKLRILREGAIPTDILEDGIVK